MVGKNVESNRQSFRKKFRKPPGSASGVASPGTSTGTGTGTGISTVSRLHRAVQATSISRARTIVPRHAFSPHPPAGVKSPTGRRAVPGGALSPPQSHAAAHEVVSNMSISLEEAAPVPGEKNPAVPSSSVPWKVRLLQAAQATFLTSRSPTAQQSAQPAGAPSVSDFLQLIDFVSKAEFSLLSTMDHGGVVLAAEAVQAALLLWRSLSSLAALVVSCPPSGAMTALQHTANPPVSQLFRAETVAASVAVLARILALLDTFSLAAKDESTHNDPIDANGLSDGVPPRRAFDIVVDVASSAIGLRIKALRGGSLPSVIFQPPGADPEVIRTVRTDKTVSVPGHAEECVPLGTACLYAACIALSSLILLGSGGVAAIADHPRCLTVLGSLLSSEVTLNDGNIDSAGDVCSVAVLTTADALSRCAKWGRLTDAVFAAIHGVDALLMAPILPRARSKVRFCLDPAGRASTENASTDHQADSREVVGDHDEGGHLTQQDSRPLSPFHLLHDHALCCAFVVDILAQFSAAAAEGRRAVASAPSNANRYAALANVTADYVANTLTSDEASDGQILGSIGALHLVLQWGSSTLVPPVLPHISTMINMLLRPLSSVARWGREKNSAVPDDLVLVNHLTINALYELASSSRRPGTLADFDACRRLGAVTSALSRTPVHILATRSALACVVVLVLRDLLNIQPDVVIERLQAVGHGLVAAILLLPLVVFSSAVSDAAVNPLKISLECIHLLFKHASRAELGKMWSCGLGQSFVTALRTADLYQYSSPSLSSTICVTIATIASRIDYILEIGETSGEHWLPVSRRFTEPISQPGVDVSRALGATFICRMLHMLSIYADHPVITTAAIECLYSLGLFSKPQWMGFLTASEDCRLLSAHFSLCKDYFLTSCCQVNPYSIAVLFNVIRSNSVSQNLHWQVLAQTVEMLCMVCLGAAYDNAVSEEILWTQLMWPLYRVECATEHAIAQLAHRDVVQILVSALETVYLASKQPDDSPSNDTSGITAFHLLSQASCIVYGVRLIGILARLSVSPRPGLPRNLPMSPPRFQSCGALAGCIESSLASRIANLVALSLSIVDARFDEPFHIALAIGDLAAVDVLCEQLIPHCGAWLSRAASVLSLAGSGRRTAAFDNVELSESSGEMYPLPDNWNAWALGYASASLALKKFLGPPSDGNEPDHAIVRCVLLGLNASSPLLDSERELVIAEVASRWGKLAFSTDNDPQ